MRNRILHAPPYSYVILVALSIFTCVLFFTTALILRISTPYTHILAALIVVFLGFMFAFLWPVGLWRWGILASCGFWLYFVAVFVSSLLHNNVAWLTIGEGIAIIASASIGAGVGRRFSLARRTQIS